MFSRSMTIFSFIVVLSAGTALAVPDFTFTTADAPLPGFPGTGLSGSLWTGVNVDTLAAAEAYIGGNAPDAVFNASTVDYPNGSSGSTSTGTLFGTALGGDAASLSNPAVASIPVLNSIMRFEGFIAVDEPFSSLFLGIGSDDGTRLSIQGTDVLTNDGIHAFPGSGAGPAEVEFQEAGLYSVEILFFESQVSQWGIEFFLNSPGQGTPVPQRLLYPGEQKVPEPATLALWMMGLLALGTARRRKGHRA